MIEKYKIACGEKRVKIQKRMGLPELLLDCDGVLLLPAWPFA